MKCPKCSYVSHDYLDACRKCGMDLVDFKKELHLQVARPGDLDLSVVLSEHIEEMGSPGEFATDHAFFEEQVLVEPEDAAAEGEAGFDISLDDEFPDLPAEAVAPPEDGADVAEAGAFAALGEDKGAEIDTRPSSAAGVEQAGPESPPVDTIDMSDLENLDGITLDLPEEAPELADVALTPPDTPGREALPARPPSEAPEMMSELAADDLLEAELELQLEEAETEPSPPETSAQEAEADLEIDLEELDLDDEENA